MHIPPDVVLDHDFVTGLGFRHGLGQGSRSIDVQDFAASER
jgi:hypothetical protein